MKYSSFIRLARDFCIEEDKFNEICDYLDKFKDSVNEITFFNGKAHSIQKLFVTEEFIEAFKRRYPILKEKGISVGINVHPTLGFFEQGGDLIYPDAPFSVDINGATRVGNLCPSSQKTFEYIRSLYEIIATGKPDFLYVDDDIKFQYQAMCFCDECIQKFEAYSGAFRQAGMEPNAENNRKLMANDSKFQQKWFEFNAVLNGKIYSLIEEVVHKERADVELGLMTCCSPMQKSEIAHYTKCLKGDLPSIRTRPGGGLYTDKNVSEILEKSTSISVQNINLPEYVTKIEAEIENFPCQSTRKACKYIELEILSYLAAGCTGIAYSLFGAEEPLSDVLEKFKMIENITPYAKQYVDVFGRSLLSGVNYLSGFTDVDDTIRKYHYLMDYEEQFLQAGIPFCFDTSKASVFYITKKSAEFLSEETLKRALKISAFITGDALEVLNSRGLLEYTGFEIKQIYDKDSLEVETNSSFNMNSKNGQIYKRDGNQAFWWMKEYTKGYSIEAVYEHAEYLNKLVSNYGEERGYSCAIGYNKFGARIAVSGYYFASFCESYAKKYQLRNIFSWLSNGKINAHVYTNHRVILNERTICNGKLGITLINMYLDDAKQLMVKLVSKAKKISDFIYYNNGEIYTTKVKIEEKDNDVYVCIDCLPALTSGYFVIEE